MNKLILIMIIAVCSVSNVFAGPHSIRPEFRIPRRVPVKHAPVNHHHHRHHHHHHHHRHHLTPYVVGALTGLAITRAIAYPTPVVVQQPIVVRPTKTVVWEDGHYEDQVQPNGTIVRIWVPGRYVERIITQ